MSSWLGPLAQLEVRKLYSLTCAVSQQGGEGGAEQNPGHRDRITKMTGGPSVVLKMGSLPRLGNCVKLNLTNETGVLEHAYRRTIIIKACS